MSLENHVDYHINNYNKVEEYYRSNVIKAFVASLIFLQSTLSFDLSILPPINSNSKDKQAQEQKQEDENKKNDKKNKALTYVDLGFKSDDKEFFDRIKRIFHDYDYTLNDKSIDVLLIDPGVEHKFIFDLSPTQLALRTIFSLKDESILSDRVKISASNRIQFDKYIRLIQQVESTPWTSLFIFNPNLDNDVAAFYISTEYLRDYPDEGSYWGAVKNHIKKLYVYAPVVKDGKIIDYKRVAKLIGKDEVNDYKNKVYRFLDYLKEAVSKNYSGQEGSLLNEIVHNPEKLLEMITPFFGMDEDHLLSFFDWYQNPKKRVGLSISYSNHLSDPFMHHKGKYNELEGYLRIFANKKEERGLVLENFYDGFVLSKHVVKGENVNEEKENLLYYIYYNFDTNNKYDLVVVDSNHNHRFDVGDNYKKKHRREYKPITDDDFKGFLNNTEYKTLDDFLNALNNFLEEKIF